MFAASFLTAELLYFYGEVDFLRGTTKIGDFFKAVSCLQECCRSAAYWAGRQLQIHGASVEVEVVGLERSSHRATMLPLRLNQARLYRSRYFMALCPAQEVPGRSISPTPFFVRP